jgi:uncharacterized protein YndB with AHSA1/START domain
VPRTRVSRTLAAPPAAVWEVVGDPWHQARWWPRVRRMEDVTPEHFTQVLATERGKGVRADYRLLEREEPRLLRWTQQLEGTPFERLLVEAETAIELAAEGERATVVTIELRQQLRGWSRLAPFLFRRAARQQLSDALAGLDEVVGETTGT